MGKKVGDVDKKISGISGVVSATALNRETCEVENKIPVICGLGTTIVLNTKIRESKNTLKYNTLRQNILLEISEKEKKNKGLNDKASTYNLVKSSDLNIAKLATRAELKAGQDKIMKLQAFNSNCVRG